MSKQTVTFSSDRYPDLVSALSNALPSIMLRHEQDLVHKFDRYQTWLKSMNRIDKWLFVTETYATVDEYRKSEDVGFVQHYHKELIKKINSMITMLTTNPPPDAITIDYDFWVTISRNQTK